MALHEMGRRKMRLTRRFIGTFVIILILIYIINVVVFFHVQSRDQSTMDKKDTSAHHYTSKNDTTQSAVTNDFHPRWVRKPYSPNAVLNMDVLGNYEPILNMNRTGPGEYGVPVPQEESDKKEGERSSFVYGFNMVNSDKISLDRIVNDIRDNECKYWHYPEKLPTASVVIVFFNEGWSTFVRTVHSVINMSPPQLLHEVVLVDDYSDKEHLKSRLEKHMAQFGKKVKIVRNTDREGLIRSRTIGARAASGDVLVFLDAHCECSPNWLPPLLTRIAYDRTIMAAPIIDGIHWSDYTYYPVIPGHHRRGIFEWGFFYKEINVPEKELAKRQHRTEPYWSPTNAGGLFAIDRKYFIELGAYDPHLEVWGGENFELAFKVWQCGGSSEWVPCSRVGHLYRHHSVSRTMSSRIKEKMSTTLINYIRVVEVWMDDEFKEYFYRTLPATRGYPINITQQLQFKKDNHCKSFKWFMENVAYDVYTDFPPPPPNKGWGKIRSRQNNGEMCLDWVFSNSKSTLATSRCLYAHSIFRLNIHGKIGVGEQCVKAKKVTAITLERCNSADVTGPWEWNQTNGQLYNKDFELCVSASSESGKHAELEECDDTAVNQKFDIIEWYPWK